VTERKLSLANVFATLAEIQYTEVSRIGTIEFYDRASPGVAPSPAIFDLSNDPLDEDALRQILDMAGISAQAFFATLEGL
jgi:hypothetical protein